MAEQRGDYSHIISWINKQGFTPDTRMQAAVSAYWGWLVAENGWYSYSERKGFRVYKRHRESLRPADLVANEWASLVMQESTIITSSDQKRADAIAEAFGGFAVDEADNIARGFALGTLAWVNEPNSVTADAVTPDARIDVRAYDATQIIPLTFSDNDCTQAAFVGRVEYGGHDYDQCQMHVLAGGTYHIRTQLFDVRTHRPASVEGILPDLDTGSAAPTFALFRVPRPNYHCRASAMGASVFDSAVGAIKGVDEAYTSYLDHLRVGKPKMFVDSSMIERKSERGEDGSLTKSYYAFGEAGDTVFKLRKGEAGKQIEVVQPELRVDENTMAVNRALGLLSLRCGFGVGYFSWDSHAGLKTATEVQSDNSMLARNLKKNQNAMRKAIVRLVEGNLALRRAIRGEAIPDGDVVVTFDDGIITDTQADKAQMMAEIAAGIAQPWEFRVRFYGETEEDARAATAGPDAFDAVGFGE